MIVSELTFWFGSEYKVTSNFGIPKCDRGGLPLAFLDAPLSFPAEGRIALTVRSSDFDVPLDVLLDHESNASKIQKAQN